MTAIPANLRIRAYLLGVPILLTACGISQSTSTPGPFFSEQSCAPPCWETLTPGTSTTDDVLRVLSDLPDVLPASVSVSTPYMHGGGQVSTVNWCVNPPSAQTCGYAVLFDDTLVGIAFSPEGNITFASAVQELGPPDHVAFEQAMWQAICNVSLEWDDIAISATASVDNSCPSGIAPATGLPVSPLLRVVALYYAAPDALHPFDTGPVIRPWTGFAEGPRAYSDLIPGGPETWFLPLIALLAAVILALAVRGLNAAVAGFVLAAIGACVPTLKLQQSDVVFPTCGAYFANTAISGACLSLLIAGIRKLVPRARESEVPDESQPSD